jgi:hypothetical protein
MMINILVPSGAKSGDLPQHTSMLRCLGIPYASSLFGIKVVDYELHLNTRLLDCNLPLLPRTPSWRDA